MYEKPIVELVEFVVGDIVCASPEDGGLESGGGDNDNPWG